MPEFSELARAFLEEEYAESPVGASHLGLTQYDDQLDDLSEAAHARRAAAVERWTQTFSAIDPGTLSFDDAIDRDLVLASLHRRRIFEEWEVWRRHPDTYLGPGLNGVFGLFLHRLRPETELAAAAATRLRGVPGNLEDGKRNLRPELVPAILLDRAVNQARAGARYARELLPAERGRCRRSRRPRGGRCGGRRRVRGLRHLPGRDAPARPPASGPSARSATARSFATRSSWTWTRGHCGSAAASSSRSCPASCAAAPTPCEVPMTGTPSWRS